MKKKKQRTKVISSDTDSEDEMHMVLPFMDSSDEEIGLEAYLIFVLIWFNWHFKLSSVRKQRWYWGWFNMDWMWYVSEMVAQGMRSP